MALITQFDTPASVRDLPVGSPFYDQWHNYLRGEIAAETPGENGGAFYNPAITDVNVIADKMMTWMGFPRDEVLPDSRDNKRQAYIAADRLRRNRSHAQNEYFEWYVHRSAQKISKVTFVTELHNYYDELWKFDPDEVVKIYHKYVSASVQRQDLTDSSGGYNILNKWNTTHGILHYTHTINTVYAAVQLAQLLTRNNPHATDNYDARPAYAATPTSVDPRVSYDVHMLVRKGLYITLKEPVGIYIVGWDNSGITQPNGRPAPASWWKIRRGQEGMVMRLEYEVPPNKGFLVGDMTIGGRPIEFGGQLAEHITIGLPGAAGHKV